MGENRGFTFPPVPKSCGGGRREELGAYKGLVCILCCCTGLPMPMPMPMPMPPSSPPPSSYPPEYPEEGEKKLEEGGGG